MACSVLLQIFMLVVIEFYVLEVAPELEVVLYPYQAHSLSSGLELEWKFI